MDIPRVALTGIFRQYCDRWVGGERQRGNFTAALLQFPAMVSISGQVRNSGQPGSLFRSTRTLRREDHLAHLPELYGMSFISLSRQSTGESDDSQLPNSRTAQRTQTAQSLASQPRSYSSLPPFLPHTSGHHHASALLSRHLQSLRKGFGYYRADGRGTMIA